MDGTDRREGRRSSAAGVFAGRSVEVARVLEIGHHAARGGAQLMVVSGEAGIGKTAFMAAVLEQMPEFRPVVIRADESESLVRYCILSQLTAALPSRQVQLLPLLSAGPPRRW